MSAPGIPYWEGYDVDVDCSSLYNPLDTIFPCLLTPLLFLHQSADPSNILICYIYYFRTLWDVVSFLTFLSLKSLHSSCRLIFLCSCRWVDYSCGACDAIVGPHHWPHHACSPLHLILRLCFSRPLPSYKTCVFLHHHCVKSHKHTILPIITVRSC